MTTEFDQEAVLERLRATADELIDAEFAASEIRGRRDRLVVEARMARVPFRAIADACLVSHQTVANICERVNTSQDAHDS